MHFAINCAMKFLNLNNLNVRSLNGDQDVMIYYVHNIYQINNLHIKLCLAMAVQKICAQSKFLPWSFQSLSPVFWIALNQMATKVQFH